MDRVIPISQGKYAIIDVHGIVTIVSETPTIAILHKRLNCELTDSIDLREGQVLIVDDSGKIKGLPVNKKASALVSKRLGRNYVVCGDAVLANDRDFKSN